MALTLKAAITAGQTTFDVLGADDLQPGDFKTIDTETIVIRTVKAKTLDYGEAVQSRVSAYRGSGGTRAAAHAAAAELVTYSAGGEPGGVTVTVAATDPGAIGADQLWLEVIFGDESDDGGYGRLWIRNSTDDGWNSVGPVSFSDATSTLIASPEDNAELGLADSGTSYLFGQSGLKLNVGSKGWFIDAVGVHLGTGGTTPAFITGSADPSAGGGVVALPGSVYLRVVGDVGTLWQKVGVGDTAWGLMLVNNVESAPIVLVAQTVSLQALDGQLVLSASETIDLNAAVRMTALPTSDPEVAGALWADSGVVKVSAG